VEGKKATTWNQQPIGKKKEDGGLSTILSSGPFPYEMSRRKKGYGLGTEKNNC